MAHIPEPPGSDTALTQQEQDRQYFRRVLENLVDIGAELAEMILAQAKAQAQADKLNDPAASKVRGAVSREDFTLTLSRLSHSMRLSQKLADSFKPAAERAATPVRQRRVAPPAPPPVEKVKLPDNVIPFRRK